MLPSFNHDALHIGWRFDTKLTLARQLALGFMAAWHCFKLRDAGLMLPATVMLCTKVQLCAAGLKVPSIFQGPVQLVCRSHIQVWYVSELSVRSICHKLAATKSPIVDQLLMDAVTVVAQEGRMAYRNRAS
jgi:hypothetical protein